MNESHNEDKNQSILDEYKFGEESLLAHLISSPSPLLLPALSQHHNILQTSSLFWAVVLPREKLKTAMISCARSMSSSPHISLSTHLPNHY